MIFDVKKTKQKHVVRWRKFVLSLWCWGLGPIETVYSVYCTETFIFIANILPTVYPVASRSHDSILLRKFIHVAILKNPLRFDFHVNVAKWKNPRNRRVVIRRFSQIPTDFVTFWNFENCYLYLTIIFFGIKRSITFKLMRN